MEMCLESGYGVVDGVGGCTEYLRDGICLESESEKVVEKGVPLHLGILTPLVAQDAILTIFWKDGWSRTCIGCILKLEHLGKTARNQKDDYLVSFNEPLNTSLSENYVRIGNKCLLAAFFKVWVK